VLVGATELVDWHRRISGAGIESDARIDWPALMRFKRTFTDPVPEQSEAAFRDAGIAIVHGEARFVAEDRLVVGDNELEAKHFVIASGAEPRPLGIPGEEHLATSTDFLALEALPRRIVFVGAGYIAFELAHIARRAGGTEVVVLGRSKALAAFDQDLVEQLVRHTREIGVDVRLNAPVTAVEARGGSYKVHSGGEAPGAPIDTDLVVHAGGRIPKTRTLHVEKANVRITDRGAIEVNEYLQSVSNPRVYGAGDAALPPGSLPLTPVAAHEGMVVASNLLRGNHEKPDYRGIPSVVFTVPPLARVGLTEEEARGRQLPVRVKCEDTGSWFSNRRVREATAMFKTIVDAKSGQLLGAHLLGPHAEEVINIFALAVRHRLTATDLRHMIYAYPTSTSDVVYML
jgi:glutathione reductase (NADPH)